jgi:hypothetical protein
MRFSALDVAYMYNDSSIDIRANKFDGNFVHISRGGSNYIKANYNDFGHIDLVGLLLHV